MKFKLWTPKFQLYRKYRKYIKVAVMPELVARETQNKQDME